MHSITLSLLAIWWQDSLLLLENEIIVVQIMHAQLQFSSVWGSLCTCYSLFIKCFIRKSVLKVWNGTLCFYGALSYRFCFHSRGIIFSILYLLFAALSSIPFFKSQYITFTHVKQPLTSLNRVTGLNSIKGFYCCWISQGYILTFTTEKKCPFQGHFQPGSLLFLLCHFVIN